MALSTKVGGKRIELMVMAGSFTQMETIMRANGRMIRRKDLAFTSIRMVESTKDSGKKISSTVKV